MNKLSLRLATESDLTVLALIHKQAYSQNHFTALLSNETLTRYYAYFLGDGSEVLLAIKKDSSGAETVLGFAVYGQGIPERIGRFKRDALNEILFSALRHPLKAIYKFIMTLRAKFNEGSIYKPANFLLLSIAVTIKGSGVGGLLLDAMLDSAQKDSLKVVGLYVNVDNMNAINAYFARGFTIRYYLNGQFYMEALLE